MLCYNENTELASTFSAYNRPQNSVPARISNSRVPKWSPTFVAIAGAHKLSSAAFCLALTIECLALFLWSTLGKAFLAYQMDAIVQSALYCCAISESRKFIFVANYVIRYIQRLIT